MNKLVITFLLSLSFFSSVGQKIALEELISLRAKQSWEVEEILLSKGWLYVNFESRSAAPFEGGPITTHNTVTYRYSVGHEFCELDFMYDTDSNNKIIGKNALKLKPRNKSKLHYFESRASSLYKMGSFGYIGPNRTIINISSDTMLLFGGS